MYHAQDVGGWKKPVFRPQECGLKLTLGMVGKDTAGISKQVLSFLSNATTQAIGLTRHRASAASSLCFKHTLVEWENLYRELDQLEAAI